MKINNRQVGRLAGATLVGAALVSLTPAAASAAGMSDCPSGSFCVWEGNDYTKTRMGATAYYDNWDYVGAPSAFRAMNDDDDSTYNRWPTRSVSIWQHDNAGGNLRICTPVGVSYGAYTNDDEGSSHRNSNGRSDCL